jgi:hypothetical protein
MASTYIPSTNTIHLILFLQTRRQSACIYLFLRSRSSSSSFFTSSLPFFINVQQHRRHEDYPTLKPSWTLLSNHTFLYTTTITLLILIFNLRLQQPVSPIPQRSLTPSTLAARLRSQLRSFWPTKSHAKSTTPDLDPSTPPLLGARSGTKYQVYIQMSTPNSASQQLHMGHSITNMAVAQQPKPAKPASKASSTNATTTTNPAANANATAAAAQKAAKIQMHRRSRTGWFTSF